MGKERAASQLQPACSTWTSNVRTSYSGQEPCGTTSCSPIQGVINLSLVCHDRLGECEGRAHGSWRIVQHSARSSCDEHRSKHTEESNGAACTGEESSRTARMRPEGILDGADQGADASSLEADGRRVLQRRLGVVRWLVSRRGVEGVGHGRRGPGNVVYG